MWEQQGAYFFAMKAAHLLNHWKSSKTHLFPQLRPLFLYLNGKKHHDICCIIRVLLSRWEIPEDRWSVVTLFALCSWNKVILTWWKHILMTATMLKADFFIFPCETILRIWLLKRKNVAADTRKKRALFIINAVICFWHVLSNLISHLLTPRELQCVMEMLLHFHFYSTPPTSHHLHPISPNLTKCHQLQPQPNNCRADTSLCLPPCFGRIDNSRFGLTAEGRNQKSCNRKHTVTARPLKSWRRKMERWEEAEYCIVRSATEKVLYYVTGWWMAEQGGQD